MNFCRGTGKPVSFGTPRPDPGRGLLVIDNPVQVEQLIAKLKAALPLSATANPPLLVLLKEQAPGLDLPPRCQIAQIHYAGDEGGILCKITFGPDDPKGFFVSVVWAAPSSAGRKGDDVRGWFGAPTYVDIRAYA